MLSPCVRCITCFSVFPWLRSGQAPAGVRGLIIIVQMGRVTSGHLAACLFRRPILRLVMSFRSGVDNDFSTHVQHTLTHLHSSVEHTCTR